MADPTVAEKLDSASQKNNEAIGRAILHFDQPLSLLLLEVGELIDGAINDLQRTP